jgi:uncharacterized repeat protein (TIGR02543 family)
MGKEKCAMSNIGVKKRWSFLGIVAVTFVTAAIVLGTAGCDNPTGSEETSYRVAFNAGEGTPMPETQVVTKGGRVDLPSPVPVRNGYLLAGWYTDADSGRRWDFAVDTVTGDMTLYARWTVLEQGNWEVGFDAQGGNPAPEAQAVAGGGRVNPPSPVPVRDGFLLEGWYTDAASGRRWDFAVDTVAESVTLYARWTAVEAGQKVVSFDAQGGSPEPEARAVNSGAAITKPSDPVKTGYVFAGWFASPSAETAWDFAADTVTENITLYAQWTARNYAVTFDSRGGSTVAGQTVPYGGKVAAPETPVNGNLRLEGWYREAAYENKWDFAVDTISGALTLYAKWVEVPSGNYLVSFNSQGGNPTPEAQVVAGGGRVTEPAPPAQTGYVFDGWYREAEGTTVWNFAEDTVAAHTTLYARWIRVWTVTFNSREGAAVDPVTGVANGGRIAKPEPDPVREGYGFTGWLKDAEGTELWNFDEDTVTGNIILYARWTAMHTVVFDSGDGSSVESVRALSGSVIAQPGNPALANCDFEGWYRETAYTTRWDFAADTVAGDMTLYARWTVTVSFDANGGSGAPESRTLTRGATITAMPGTPAWEGRRFLGWFSAASDGELYAWPYTADESVVMYAQWVAVYTITFDTHGGPELEAVTADTGTEVPKPADPDWVGYIFNGWFSAANGGTEYTAWPHILSGNITMHAQWTATGTRTITFDTHGGPETESITNNVGTEVSKPADPHWLGYSFNGWFNAASGGTLYTWPHTLNADLTMHAQWTSIATHTITFDSHDGSPVEAITDNEGTKVARPADPGRPDYTFNGWFSAASGGAEYEWPHTLNADLTMHAQWTIISNNQGIGLTYEDLIDKAGSALSEPSFSLAKSGGTATKTISVSGSDNDEAVRWYVGLALIHTGSGVTLNAANLSPGKHTLQVTAEYGGILYSKEIAFTVTVGE